MARLEAPVMNTRRCAPAARASSTAYWISGLSTTGSISLGLALVAAAGIADAHQERAERARLRSRLDPAAEVRSQARKSGGVRGRQGGGEKPGELPRRDPAALVQPLPKLAQHVGAPDLASAAEHRGNDLERKSRRHLERVQVEEQRTRGVTGLLGDTRGEDVGPRQLPLVRARLPQQRPRALAVTLHQRVLGELAEVVGGDPPPLGLHGRRQLVEHLERLGPVALGLVDGYQLIERRVPVLARSRQLLEDTLGPVHESRALIVERQSERGLVAQAWTAVIAQARMKRDGAIDLAAAPEQAPQRELHLGGIALRLGGHAREDLSGVIE